ncbi:MAG TPA: hypothetical protein VHY08_27575 [Bacillota bacterium]|nr:hypothetical protein [Bacillota bacterium]
MKEKPGFVKMLPELAWKMKKTFETKERLDLASQIDNLNIFCLCECREDDCGSFYFVEPPNIDIPYEVFPVQEGINVTVYDGTIGRIEILPIANGMKIRKKLKEVV